MVKDYFKLVTFSHTIFALPFAFLGYFLAVSQPEIPFQWQTLVLVVLCMIFARNAAMAFNRYIDRDIDGKNPRTAIREIPAGKINEKSALGFVIFNCIAFVATTFFINKLCFYLSPIALLIILGYSATKRFTFLCHFVLGLGLSLAPLGAYLAAGGGFDTVPILYSFAVLLWVSGFDIIYALQDESFDKSLNLNSIPVKLGSVKSLKLSSILHFICGLIILGASYLLGENYPAFGWMRWLAAVFFIGMLIYQHTLVSPTDLTKVDRAFFTTNGLASVVFGALMIGDLYF
jgi:4-hydroxybenzoate polyprenyltransferase